MVEGVRGRGMDRLARNEVAGYASSVGAVALAETAQFMVSTSAIGNPVCLYLGLVVKVALFVTAWLRPDALLRFARGRSFACVWATMFACSVAVLNVSAAFPLLCAASTVFYACEATAVLAAVGMLYEQVPDRMHAQSALAGVVAAFCLAAVLFSVPSWASLPLQVAVAVGCAVLPAVSARHDGAVVSSGVSSHPSASTLVHNSGAALGGNRARVPGVLVAAIGFFVVAIQVVYMSLWTDCDWAAAFSLAVVVSAVLLLLEFGVLRTSRVSLLDLTCALMVGVPVIFVGAGEGPAAPLVSMASIGLYLFLPRIIQVCGATAREAGGSALAVFAQAELALNCLEVVGTLAMESPLVSLLGPTSRLAAAVGLAMGCVLSVFALYEVRTRSIIYGFIDDSPARVPTGGLPTGGLPAGGPSSTPVGVASDGPEEVLPDSGSDASDNGAGLKAACHKVALEGPLTAKEEEVLLLLVRGSTISGAAETLGVSMSTAKSHVYHIYQKLGVHTREELAALVEGALSTGSPAAPPAPPSSV